MKMKRILCTVLTALTLLGASAQAPEKGDVIADLGIGVGAMDGASSEASFTQRIAIEWGMLEFETLNSDWTLTLGFQLNNGAWTKSGSDHVTFEKWRSTQDDLTFMPTASLHHGFSNRIDGYATLGMGFGLLNSRSSTNIGVWGNTDASFAMALNLGMRYWINANWGINAQFGMVSAAWKDGYGSYNILSVGASYKF